MLVLQGKEGDSKGLSSILFSLFPYIGVCSCLLFSCFSNSDPKIKITKKKKQQTPSGGVGVEQIARDLPLSRETWHMPENVMSVFSSIFYEKGIYSLNK